MNVIETHDLSRRFGRTEAVNGLSLAVPEGSLFALLGTNGAGKTTTIKLVLDLLRPNRGSASVFGVDSRRLGEREKAEIGYVSENQELPVWMTVRQLLDYCRPFYPTWDRHLERQLLRDFELPANTPLKHLSRGMLMKAALVSSLAYRPRLLILDEPFSGLDPVVRDDFVRGVLEIASRGEWTVFLSSHDIEEVERLADHIAVLDAGRLTLSESTDQLQSRFRRIEVTLDDLSPDLTNLPGHWINVERSGALLRFVDTHYDRGVAEPQCRERFANASVIAKPMSLREIFLVLARSRRGAAVEASA